jgi:serine/threonine protein kinase
MAGVTRGLLNAFQGRYVLERELGHGGMATVYLASDPAGTPVAVKVLSSQLAPIVGTERFAREIRISSSLQHPGLLPVIDSGIIGDVSFYVSPYIPGGSLADRLTRDGPLPIEEAVDIACAIAEVLEVVHGAGFVHRDIKPSNILLGAERVLLADFGLARAIERGSEDRLTSSGIVVGTPAYMSPEQGGSGAVDSRSDLYSLGCVLYEMLSGAPPFSGATPQSINARHAVDPVPSLHTVRSTVSPALEHVIVKALAKVPADRYPTPAHFRDALRGAVAAGEAQPRGRSVRLAAALGVLALALVAWGLSRSPADRLDPQRVMVFPLVSPLSSTESRRTIGEDVATMIGAAVDGVGPLRWIDAWHYLDARRRNDIRALDLSEARALARSQRCGSFVIGRVVDRGDSTDVYLDLNAVQGDSAVARVRASGLNSNTWRTGLRAVAQVLPALIAGAPRELPTEWNDRDPGAIASFLLGERAFRRLHLADALTNFRAAVERDSSFGLAAIRGAQAATWSHRSDQARALVRVALARPLPTRYRHFALGYEAYLGGWADSAAAELHRALAVDPDMTVAWMQLGETYTHLLPAAGNADSLATAAFEEARRIDPVGSGLFLHLIEAFLRQGDTARAAPLVHDFLAADPDTTLASQIRLSAACVTRGVAAAWGPRDAPGPLALLSAGNSLKGGGAQLPCAAAALAAVIDADTSSAGELRWFALLQLQSIHLARGRARDAATLIDSPVMRGDGESIYLVDGPVYPEMGDRARQVARHYRRECGPAYRGCSNPVRLWELGVWAAHEGEAEQAEMVARELAARAPRPGFPRDSSVLPILAGSVAAHAALARGDTASAVSLFRAVLSRPVPGEYLNWDVASPRGIDRLRLAQILAARREFEGAIQVANAFESAWPSVYLLYLPASLRLRADAAAAMGDQVLAARFRVRLDALAGRWPEEVVSTGGGL